MKILNAYLLWIFWFFSAPPTVTERQSAVFLSVACVDCRYVTGYLSFWSKFGAEAGRVFYRGRLALLFADINFRANLWLFAPGAIVRTSLLCVLRSDCTSRVPLTPRSFHSTRASLFGFHSTDSREKNTFTYLRFSHRRWNTVCCKSFVSRNCALRSFFFSVSYKILPPDFLGRSMNPTTRGPGNNGNTGL